MSACEVTWVPASDFLTASLNTGEYSGSHLLSAPPRIFNFPPFLALKHKSHSYLTQWAGYNCSEKTKQNKTTKTPKTWQQNSRTELDSSGLGKTPEFLEDLLPAESLGEEEQSNCWERKLPFRLKARKAWLLRWLWWLWELQAVKETESWVCDLESDVTQTFYQEKQHIELRSTGFSTLKVEKMKIASITTYPLK